MDHMAPQDFQAVLNLPWVYVQKRSRSQVQALSFNHVWTDRMDPRHGPIRFVFGDYVLDPDRRELVRGSDLIAVGPQVFDLLMYLVRNRERVVTKDDLIEAVWGGRIVSESTLTS